MKTALPFIQKHMYCSVLKAVFYGLVVLLHYHFKGWFTDKRSKCGKEVWSGWPSTRPARDETEKIEKEPATGWAEGLSQSGFLFYSS